MGLQNQLSDFSSESILIFMVVLIGRSVRYLHTLLFTVLQSVGPFSPRFDADRHNIRSSIHGVVGSGLASLVVLCDQLNLNRVCSYTYRKDDDGNHRFGSDCVVCLNRLGDGDHVRRLGCRHVFHKDCLDGWLDHLNFNCPLCRAPLVTDERVNCTQKRVESDLLAWFPFH